MGCWNKTCGVSNLPILAGEPVIALILMQNPYFDKDKPLQQCSYVDDFWKPLGFPIQGVYNDYGWVESVTISDELLLTIETIKRNLIEFDDIKCEDDIIKAHLLGDDIENNIEIIGNWIHGNLLKVNYNGKHVPISWMLIHKKIYDFMSEYNTELILNHIQENDSYYTLLNKRSTEDELYNPIKYYNSYGDGLSLLNLIHLVKKHKPELLDSIIQFMTFNNTMSATRRHYQPMSYEGSQDVEYDIHELLLNNIMSVLEENRKIYDDI